MLTNTDALQGIQLAYIVAKLEGRDVHADSEGFWFRDTGTHPDGIEVDYTGPAIVLRILGREGISLRKCRTLPELGWIAKKPKDKTTNYYQTGPEPEIAVLRCFVESRLGEEVEIPDELIAD